MKLTEKNVLISTGILFVIVLGMLKLGNKEMPELLNIDIAFSSYNVDEGKLVLQFDKPAEQYDFFRITVIDENNNSFSGKPKLENDYVVFDTHTPELNFKDPLKIIIEEATSKKELELDYKIPEEHIITAFSIEIDLLDQGNIKKELLAA